MIRQSNAARGEGASRCPEVPAFPVLSAEVDEDGAWFQGHRVELREGEEPAAAVMRLAAEAAGARDGAVKAVRVRASSGGAAWDLIVDESGQVWDAPAKSRSAVSGRQKVGLFAALAGVIVLPVAVAAAIVVPRVAGGDEVAAATTRTVTVEPPKPSPTQLPVLAPFGGQAVAVWSSAPVSSSGMGSAGSTAASPAVVVGSCVAVVERVDRGSAVTCLRADTGAQVWSVRLDASGASLRPMKGGVVVTSSSGARVIDGSGRVLSSRKFSGGEQPAIVGAGFAVTSSKSSALIDVAGKWVPRVIPAGARIVGVSGAAAVMTDTSGQAWSVTDGRVAPAGVRLVAPSKDAKPVGPLGVTSDGFLYAWQEADRVVVQRYRNSELSRPVMTSRVPEDAGSGAIGPGQVAVSPGDRLAVVQGHLVDLVTGTARALPKGWRTTSVLDSQVTGQVQGSSVVVDAQARPLWTVKPPTGVDVGVPVAELSGMSFIAARAGAETRVYAVRTVLPAERPSSPSSSSVPSSTSGPVSPSSGSSSSTAVQSSSPSAPASSKAPTSTKGAAK